MLVDGMGHLSTHFFINPHLNTHLLSSYPVTGPVLPFAGAPVMNEAHFPLDSNYIGQIRKGHGSSPLWRPCLSLGLGRGSVVESQRKLVSVKVCSTACVG